MAWSLIASQALRWIVAPLLTGLGLSAGLSLLWGWAGGQMAQQMAEQMIELYRRMIPLIVMMAMVQMLLAIPMSMMYQYGWYPWLF